MFTKKLSETGALLIAIRVLWLSAISVVVGVWVSSTAGFAVFGAGLAIGLLLELRPDRKESHPLDAAAREGGSHNGRHVLVIANTALEGEVLAGELAGHGQIDVLAPPLMSRTHLVMNDTDREQAEAQARLDRSLEWARSHGLQARGEVGDTDVVAGIADELRGFGADEILVVTRGDDARHITRRELERLRADLAVPVREVAI